MQPNEDFSATRWITTCCVLLIAALWTVGVVASEFVRHVVQTAPIWIAVAMSLRRSGLGKWAALARVISGPFSRTEIVLTLVIGVVSLCGIVNCIRLKVSLGVVAASATFLVALLLQAAAIALSITSAIAHR